MQYCNITFKSQFPQHCL